MSKKEIQRARIRQYFIDATREVIREEGIGNVTIRKVADLAGYNSATIYNYFEDVSHLIFFAAMTYLREYVKDLAEHVKHVENALDEYLLIWERFCVHSFSQPEIYHAIFGSNLGELPDDIVKSYYDMSPDDLDDLPPELLPMLLEANLNKRSEIALQRCIQAGYVNPADSQKVTNLIVLIYTGMLSLFYNKRRNYTVETATTLVVEYIRIIIVTSKVMFNDLGEPTDGHDQQPANV
ncbi:MAG: TetR family transcriptional regulator [Sulfobacillus benefaciens]|uniref:TetR family transcriptional regulator n=1 Tax=Sulfobacillus benefaciens TaxID=453960 RepID=A0A2T2XE71_9FIRM|nr:MAG: TetR family transcriptional regulator [Sulfobacillus benefaciens]